MDIADASYFRNLIGLVLNEALDRPHDGDEPCATSALTLDRHLTPFAAIDQHTVGTREVMLAVTARSYQRESSFAFAQFGDNALVTIDRGHVTWVFIDQKREIVV